MMRKGGGVRLFNNSWIADSKEQCETISPNGWRCGRVKGHGNRHLAFKSSDTDNDELEEWTTEEG